MKFNNFRLSDPLKEELLNSQDECSISWLNRDGWPVGVIQSYLWHDGAFWVTAFANKPRVEALKQRPKATVMVSSKGTDLGPEKMISAKVLATVHDDDGTKTWFYPAFAARVQSDEHSRQLFAAALAKQDRVVIELRPVSWLSFDGMLLRENAKKMGRS